MVWKPCGRTTTMLPRRRAFSPVTLLVSLTIIYTLYSFTQHVVIVRESDHPSDLMPGILLHPEIHVRSNRIFETWVVPVTNVEYDDVILPDSPCVIKDLMLVILVHSRPHFAQARQAIRHTWGQFSRSRRGIQGPQKEEQAMELYFVAGLSESPDVNTALLDESAKFGDIIQFGFIDSYFNLTLKSLLDLRWASEHCRRASYVMKADDDVFIDVHSLISFLRNWGVTQNAILGDLRHNAPVFRDHPKWGVPYHRFPDDTYPDYLKGAAYVMTPDLPQRLSDVAPFVSPIHIDDVFVTGILAGKTLGVDLVVSNSFRTWESMSPSPCMLHVIKRVIMTGPSNPTGIKTQESDEYHEFMHLAFRWLYDSQLKAKCWWQTPIWKTLSWIL